MWPQPPVHVQRVLVTGGAGFIGSHFIEDFLAQVPHVQVLCLDCLKYASGLQNMDGFAGDPRFEFINVDLVDEVGLDEALQERPIDWVFHFAAETHVDRSIHDPRATINSNLVGTFNLLDYFRRAWHGKMSDKRYIQVSTDEVFGSLDEGSFSESSTYHPGSPYSASKAGGDHLAAAYHNTYGMPTITTWCSNNYGPRQYPEKLIPLITHRASKGESLPVYGSGAQVRDWLYVKDHGEGVWRAACLGKVGEGYCFGGGEELTNRAIVEAIAGIVAREQGIEEARLVSLIESVEDRPGHDHRYSLDASKARSELDWTPRTSFQEGLEQTVRWYLTHQEWVTQATGRDYDAWVAKHYGQTGGSK